MTNNRLGGVATGLGVTSLIQSSSATTVLLVSLVNAGLVSLRQSIGVVMGANIGTTLTAWIVSIVGFKLRITDFALPAIALAHMIFNILGVLWMLTIFYPFTRFVDMLMPGDVSDPASIPLHLSLFHTLFNVTNTALLIGFVPQLARLVEAIVPDRVRVAAVGGYRISLIAPNLPDAIDSNLITIRRELSRMSEHAIDMLKQVMNASSSPDTLEATRKRLAETEQYVDDMQETITGYLTSAMQDPISEDQARYIHAAQRVAHEIEGISDACYSIALLLDKLHRKGRRFHEEGDQELFSYTRRVMEFLRYNNAILDREIDRPDLDAAHAMENGIDKVRNKLRKRSRRSIEQNIDVDVRGELIFIDIIRHLEHIGDNSLNISEAVGELA